MVTLDFTSDSAAVVLDCSEEEAELLGWEICGCSIEHATDGFCYALIGEAWDSDLSDAENDAHAEAVLLEVEAELAAAGVDWTEG